MSGSTYCKTLILMEDFSKLQVHRPQWPSKDTTEEGNKVLTCFAGSIRLTWRGYFRMGCGLGWNASNGNSRDSSTNMLSSNPGLA